MAKTLVSPGVSVEVIDESFYAPSGPGTVPFILMATQQDKINPSGQIAEGTTLINAGRVYSVTSRRELLNLFGSPTFPKNASGNAIFGSELAEYGLLAAHSVLEISSRAYVMRANVDLTQLVGTGTRPTATPEGGTLWLDITANSWGIFEWSSETQTFTRKVPRVITNTADLLDGVPRSSIGRAGEYAVVTTNTNNPVYFKDEETSEWVLVGSQDWQVSWPTIQASNAAPTLTIGNSIEINGEIVTLTGNNVSQAAASINAANITGVTAVARNGILRIFATEEATSDGSTVDGLVSISNVSGTPLTALGIDADTYACPAVQLSFHTQIPEWKNFDDDPRPTGSVWVKTTAVANGANFVIYRWNANTSRWQLLNSPLFANDESALRYLDPTRGGLGVALNNLYVQYDINENSTVTYKVLSRTSTGVTRVTGTDTTPSFVIGESFTIYASDVGTTNLNFATVTMTGITARQFVSDLLSHNIPYINAYVAPNGAVVIEHTQGGVIYLDNVSGTPLGDAGITASNDFCRTSASGGIIASNWEVATYVASTTGPVQAPATGTMWYYSTPIEVDVMMHNGTIWKGYKNVSSDARGFDLTQTDPNGVLIAASEPTEQSDGTALVYGDLWLDTSDLENYPRIYRYESVNGEDRFVELDVSDDTSENGVVFADARWDTDGTADVALDEKPSIASLLTSDYVDLDGPDPAIYPRGILLFNTRRSSYNVKEYVKNYYNIDNFPLEIMPTERATWRSISGARINGVPFFGRKAVRNIVVEALREAIDTSEELREDSRFFNLIACPGYTELIQSMVELNTARRETAFILGDLPMGLSSDSTTLENYLTNTSGELEDTEDALITNNTFVATFYPSAGLSNDTTGSQVAVPSSHMMLRTFIKSDNKSFPWFAPAGEQRGTVDNASAIGYVNRANGNFVSIGTREGLRDLLYINRVNPIAVFSGIGILNYGQKTRASASTALDRVNVARLIAYIRYQLERITKPLIFEPNDKITRDEAKQAVESLLNDILANRGLYDYLVVCDESNNTPERIDRNELHIDVAIEPTKAVEFIYIPVRIKNTGEISSGNNVSANRV